MAKEIQVTATLPALPDGYGPDVHFGPQEDRPHVYFYDGLWLTTECGDSSHRFHAYKREPVKRVVWVNYDADGSFESFRTKDRADISAYPDRIARVRVEFEEGRFDE